MAKQEYYDRNFKLSMVHDKSIVDFMKAQSKLTPALKLGMEVLIMLFGKGDLEDKYSDIKKYGLINILDKRLCELKIESLNYIGKNN